ncbi:MAG: class I SAM-dependent methyltransferase [Chitinophagaceae bacterium]|nr:class I SAM-dependent methyltransferase [Chitinophagaceae bacterium]
MMATLPDSDPAGRKTLELFADAHNFNRWMLHSIVVYCQGHILEIGSGIGNISALLLQHFTQVTLSDLRLEYCDLLKEKFKGNNHLRGVMQIDLAAPNFEETYSDHLFKFDTVVLLNVIEHIEDDHLAIENCRKLLKTNGNMIILVPAFQALYNPFDRQLGHYRRYTSKSLAALISSADLEITHTKYFNFIGIGGWLFSGSLLRKRIIPGRQLRIFNTLIPLFRFFDRYAAGIAGLSVIAVGKRVQL